MKMALLIQNKKKDKIKQITEISDIELYKKANKIWKVMARPDQLPPDNLPLFWVIMAGRGFGKTRTGAEWIANLCSTTPGLHVALVAKTPFEARTVMIQGDSGILNAFSNYCDVEYNTSLRQLTWANGSKATIYSSEVPDNIRGHEHDYAWCDEVASWRDAIYVIKMLILSMRRGEKQSILFTFTPKRNEATKYVLGREGAHIVRGSTYDNIDNLPEQFISEIKLEYEGTRLGQQEIYAEVLDDVEGALWTQEMLLQTRLRGFNISDLDKIIIGVDPALTAKEMSDETGIVVVGVQYDPYEKNHKYYVLEDASGRHTPEQWGNMVRSLYGKYSAYEVVGETNVGGEMIESVITDNHRHLNIQYRGIYSSSSKASRCAPIISLYQQGRVKHPENEKLSKLEEQMLEWVPGESRFSPDRIDALVMAITALRGEGLERSRAGVVNLKKR